jgi:hypothetical protein
LKDGGAWEMWGMMWGWGVYELPLPLPTQDTGWFFSLSSPDTKPTNES